MKSERDPKIGRVATKGQVFIFRMGGQFEKSRYFFFSSFIIRNLIFS